MTDLVEKLRSNSALPVCPYSRLSPEYWTTSDDEPCKFCGQENTLDGPDKCTGADLRIMKDAATEIERLKAENEALLEEIEKYRHGHQGSCYACEPVGMLNQALEERLKVAREGLRGIVAWFDDEPTTIEDWGPSYVIPVSAPAFSADLERARQTLSQIGEKND